MISSVNDHDHGQYLLRIRISISQDISTQPYVSVS
jgi:hypothetical protein